MVVQVLSLGINWWSRSRLCSDPQRQAYYNSTGVRCGRKVRRHWLIPGMLRFNGVNFDRRWCMDACGKTFLCSDLNYAYGGNRLLFLSHNFHSAPPDFYLVTISSDVYGSIDFSSNVWRSVFSRVIAISQLRSQQEAMLLMGAGDWLQTSSGFWRLRVASETEDPPALLRVGERQSLEETD